MNCLIVRAAAVPTLVLSLILAFCSTVLAMSPDNSKLAITIVSQSGDALEHAVVSLHSDEALIAAPSVLATMDQRQLQYSPNVLAIQAGTSVSFPNEDDVRHHVYSFSHPNAFELKLYHGEEGKSQRFMHPGIVVLGCNIHDGMLGYLRVVDTPLFASSDVSGKMQLDGIPPGTYQMQIWHPDLGMQLIKKSITLKAGSFAIQQTLDVSDNSPGEPKAAHPLQSLFDD